MLQMDEEDAETWVKACDRLRYFEVFEGSGKWSFGVPADKHIDRSQYNGISDQIVFVTKIPLGVQSIDIDGIFSEYGQVTFCRLRIDKQHNSLQTAVVIYTDPKSAVKAISARGAEEEIMAKAFYTGEEQKDQKNLEVKLFVKHLPLGVTEP